MSYRIDDAGTPKPANSEEDKIVINTGNVEITIKEKPPVQENSDSQTIYRGRLE